MPWTAADIPPQTGKVAVVTGANSGLGLSTTRRLAERGATVIMGCRNARKAADAEASVRAAVPGARLLVLDLDLASLDSVRDFARQVEERFPSVDLLINNAGVMAIPRALTADGFEMQLGVNHLGHFALTGLLYERLAKAPAARVVSVSSNAHRAFGIDLDDPMGERAYNPLSAYSASKIANLLFHYELTRRLDRVGARPISVAAHPGWTQSELATPGASQVGVLAPLLTWAHKNLAMATDKGALPQLRAATASDVRPGDYFGPGGLNGMYGYPVPEQPRALVRDAELGRRLWELSERLTGVRFDALT